jgi:Transcription factor WhiB
VMRRVLVIGSRAWIDTATIGDALATVWGGGTAVVVSGACPTGADEIAETIWTLTSDLPGGLCAGHPYPSPWDAELDGVRESAAQRTQRHREAQTICRRCPIMAACLASRAENPQLGGGVWGGEVFQDKETTAGQPAPSKPVATDPVETTRNQPALTGSRRHCHPPLTEQQAQRRWTECLAGWRRPHPGFRWPGGDNRRSGLTDGRSA